MCSCTYLRPDSRRITVIRKAVVGNLHRNFANYRRGRIKITNDTDYYQQLNVHRCNINPVGTRLQSIFFFFFSILRGLKRGQNDGSHLEMYLCEWLKLKSKVRLRQEHPIWKRHNTT